MSERIERAAIKLLDGSVWSQSAPARHHNVLHAITACETSHVGHDQGFLTSEGRFVDREEALKIATAADQLNGLRNQPGAYRGPELFSEDLW